MRVKLRSSSFRFMMMLLLAAAMTGSAAASPVVLGLTNKHPLTTPQAGALLINELRCGACHQVAGTSGLPERFAPDLSQVGSRVSPAFLQKFIASPSTTVPGTTMPDLFTDQTPQERLRIATAIEHYLVSLAKHPFQRDPSQVKDADAGHRLYHTIGCVACHSPRDDRGKQTMTQGVVSLAHVSEKYSRRSLAEFLFDPLHVRPGGRMPDMKLTHDDAEAIADYLISPSRWDIVPVTFNEDPIALGKRYFQQYRCAACHKLEGFTAPPAGKLNGLDLHHGCMSDDPGPSPRFHLSDDQAAAIRAAIAAGDKAPSDQARIEMTLTAFNCIACHNRDNYGGVSDQRNPYFQSTLHELGDPVRLPPPLTLIGAKLQTGWIRNVMFDGDSVRPYMLTRMPQFGETNLRYLPDLFARVDHVEPVKFAEVTRKTARTMREAGALLLGDKGLNCIACHNFNGKASPGFAGLDLITSATRLQPDWFAHFLRAPSDYRPGIVMPSFWPNGKAARADILHGDTEQQIEAIWYVLSRGRTAPMPSGIRRVQSKLVVTDKPRTYRGRSQIAGYRGIAVGFPGGLNYAFDAETGTLSGIWSGGFVDVDWSGQGSGSFSPSSPAVSLAKDVSFLHLSGEHAAWPKLPVMTKEHPVNPNPLYPKNLGYQFEGYFFDDQDVTTLTYRLGDIEIEDRSVPDASTGHTTLVRTFTFTSPKDQTIWFRALTGRIQAGPDHTYHTPALQVAAPDTRAVLRDKPDDKGKSELLLELSIPKGKSKVTIRYELLH